MVPECQEQKLFPVSGGCLASFKEEVINGSMRQPPRETVTWIIVPLEGTKLPSRCASSGEEGKEKRPW